jgi:hypothetical protein
MGVIRDPAEIAALCGHAPPRGGCHLCRLAARLAGQPAPIAKKPCGCDDCDHDCADKGYSSAADHEGD